MAIATKQKHPVHNARGANHRRRYGAHQKHTKSFMKTYWPYLPLVLVAGLGLFVNVLWSNHSRGVLGYSTNVSATALLDDTNTNRAQNHESALSLNSRLMSAAQAKANSMVKLNYWSHYTPSGNPPWVFIKQAGYNYTSAGENLAYGFNTSEQVLVAWMNSTPHRANILDANYQNVGFGIANSPNYQGNGPQTVVVAMYGQPAGVQTAAATQPSPAAPATYSAPTELASSNSQSVSRIQILTAGNAPWSLFVVSILAAIALTYFVLKHGLAWRRVLVKGEDFVVHHPWLDVAVVCLIMASFLLDRTAGTIL